MFTTSQHPLLHRYKRMLTMAHMDYWIDNKDLFMSEGTYAHKGLEAI